LHRRRREREREREIDYIEIEEDELLSSFSALKMELVVPPKHQFTH
jgi:hypothetical protein